MANAKPYGIPTTYKNVRFRSRLEAKWAAFFDLCGWDWTYEPFEYPGWIPDFLIEGDILVEVKPFSTNEEFYSLTDEIDEAQRRVKCDREVLICGCRGPFVVDSDACGKVETIGLLGEVGTDPLNPFAKWWEWSAFGLCYESRKWDFCHCIGHYMSRVHRLYPGGTWPEEKLNDAKAMWAQAGNLTQWNPR